MLGGGTLKWRGARYKCCCVQKFASVSQRSQTKQFYCNYL